jgi:hypothetical protein
MSATLLHAEAVLAGLGCLGGIACGVQAAAAGGARLREKALEEQRSESTGTL